MRSSKCFSSSLCSLTWFNNVFYVWIIKLLLSILLRLLLMLSKILSLRVTSWCYLRLRRNTKLLHIKYTELMVRSRAACDHKKAMFALFDTSMKLSTQIILVNFWYSASADLTFSDFYSYLWLDLWKPIQISHLKLQDNWFLRFQYTIASQGLWAHEWNLPRS